MKQDKS